MFGVLVRQVLLNEKQLLGGGVGNQTRAVAS